MRRADLLNSDGLTEKEFLDRYTPGDYERPSVTVDMLLFTVMDKKSENHRMLADKELKILLIKRKDHPCIGQWAIPGGFVDIHESIEDAVYRELKEETNVDNVYCEQLFTWGDVKRDPRMRVVSVSHMALVSNKNLKPVAGDDASDVDWFTIRRYVIESNNDSVKWVLSLVNSDETVKISYEIEDKYVRKGVSLVMETKINPVALSNEGLAFDHVNILNLALERLKNKIEHTSVAFNLVDKYFTMAELKKVYEVILNHKIHDTAFRRMVRGMVIETDMTSDGKAHKPAKYYKYNKNWVHKY